MWADSYQPALPYDIIFLKEAVKQSYSRVPRAKQIYGRAWGDWAGDAFVCTQGRNRRDFIRKPLQVIEQNLESWKSWDQP